ncbi:hypothetical protein BIU82_00760 [Arthrobacter sp. SW1]|uniref:GNAT family N-acetyltransferase n=1 Tax=Arthrobacter sp. SW1 TaxID=1920889 RepID=UPI000877D6F9|nr:GNAT family N-acetyltransferase [Arthrobacter sp. SW1]OFI39633.1 hypothetical protein BIU82_00760 [Arthrobacter sp. SW1]
MHQIRAAGPSDFACLPAIEDASDTLLAAALAGPDGGPVPSLPAVTGVPHSTASLCVLVAGNPPHAFARLEEVDGQVHLEQLSVHPAHVRQGLGRALVEAALGWARERGYGRMTLSTYRDVPFNAPFYARCGFVPLAEPGPELAALRRHEQGIGLDLLGPRICMAKEL